MHRRISALVVTAALAGGALLTAVPAQAATTATQQGVVARGAVKVNIDELAAQARALRSKAAKLDRAGNHAAAKKARAQAAAIDKRIAQLLDAEKHA